jgi:pimeloyl-ACP methyl ester carboxylesterase
MLHEAQTLIQLGTSVLLVDFRGSGGSSENYTTIGVAEAEDVRAALAHGHSALSHQSFILFGQSMGAAAILRSIHLHEIQPDAVILEAVFDSLLKAIQNRFDLMEAPAFPAAEFLLFWGGRQFSFNAFRHRPVDYASSLNVPALFLHGGEDRRALPADARRVFDRVSSPKSFILFEKGGHGSCLSADKSRWKEHLRSFLHGS